LEYGIGLPAKMAPDGGNNQLIVQPMYPIGTDPMVMDRLLRIAADPKQSERLVAAIDRLGLDSGDQARQPQPQKRNPSAGLPGPGGQGRTGRRQAPSSDRSAAAIDGDDRARNVAGPG
jgi:hypothetical protein